MPDPGNVASDRQREVWGALARVVEPLYLLVGRRKHAQAHLLGSFALERVDGEDVIVLRGTSTHVHVDWSAIVRLERCDQDGYDSLRFLGPEHPLVEVLVSDPRHRYGAAIAALIAPPDGA
jgi:hypothetical protein